MINNGEKVYIVSVNDMQYIGRLSYKGIQAYLKLQGFQGTPGASIVWKGTWASGSSYSVLDAVTYNGQIYIAKSASTNKVPTNTDFWDLACEKGADGEIGLNWLGAWNSGTTYEVGDGVSNDGSSYICILESTNNKPPNATYWGVLALAGTSTLDIHGLTAKTTPVDNDEIPISDSEDSYNNKKILFSKIVPSSRTVNSKALSSNITLNQDDIGDGSTYVQFSGVQEIQLAKHEEAMITTKEPTGMVSSSDTTLAFNDSTFEFSISPTGANFSFFHTGIKYTKTTTQTVTITDANNIYYIYFDSSGVLQKTTDGAVFFANCQVATVYWNTTTNKYAIGNEKHGLVMDASTHAYLHFTVGTRFESGFGATFGDTTFSLDEGVIWDEDLKHSIGAQTQCKVFYKDGAADFTMGSKGTLYYYTSGGNIYYNNGNTLTAADSNKYVAYWIFATNDPDCPIYSLMGQRQDTTIASARENNKYESLSLGTLPFKEMKLLYRVILHNDPTPYSETQDLRSISNLSTGTYVATDHNSLTNRNAVNSHPASAIAPDTTNFNAILSSSDDTTQKALDTLDNHSHNYLVPTGGTTDQVLAKNSNTNGDLKWATAGGGSGDITKDELAAGTTVTDITTGAYVAITRPGTPNTIEKITKASLTTLFATDVGAAINGASAETVLATGDKIPFYDVSASALKYITQANFEAQQKLAMFPVGAVVMYDNSTSDPNTLIGGTWSRIDGPAFPGMYKSGDTNMGTPMGTFGSNTKNLQHTHTVATVPFGVKGTGGASDSINAANTGNGLSTTQDVLNAGITLCFWRRTA